MKRKTPREVVIDVSAVSSAGIGRGVFEDRQVEAKNALAGERVVVKILKRRKGVWHGEAITPSEDSQRSVHRIDPACRFYPRCGGCAMQHVDYSYQLELKQAQLTAALADAGVVAQTLLPPVQGPRLGYRTKARLGVRVVGGEVLVGFRETLSNRVSRMTSCEILIPEFARLLQPLRQLIAALRAPERIPQVEIAAGDSEQALVFRHLQPLTEADEELLKEFARKHQVRVYGQGGGYDSVCELSVSSNPYLGYSNPDFGLYYQFLPWDFTQVNLQMNRALVRTALCELGSDRSRPLLDLFCGIGNFGLAAAAAGWQVQGYEASADSIERAVMNARLNGLTERCEFRVADLYDPGCVLEANEPDLLLDPPRSGAGANLPAWLEKLQPRRVVYVSCHPDSFASDAAVLKKQGYVLERVGIFDMFPNTAHVETIGSFCRTW
jgi:23S rRNA (uracil1939-C5)-methyltransferase